MLGVAEAFDLKEEEIRGRSCNESATTGNTRRTATITPEFILTCENFVAGEGLGDVSERRFRLQNAGNVDEFFVDRSCGIAFDAGG